MRIAHGAAHFLKERLFDYSDAYRVHICEICGLVSVANLKKNTFDCFGCKNKTKISQVRATLVCVDPGVLGLLRFYTNAQLVG